MAEYLQLGAFLSVLLVLMALAFVLPTSTFHASLALVTKNLGRLRSELRRKTLYGLYAVPVLFLSCVLWW